MQKSSSCGSLVPKPCNYDNCCICAYGPPPSFFTSAPTWADICYIALYCLTLSKRDIKYFHIKKDICTFIDAHYESICMRKRTSIWRQTVNMTLSHPQYFEMFQQESALENGRKGYYGLKQMHDPYEHTALNLRSRRKRRHEQKIHQDELKKSVSFQSTLSPTKGQAPLAQILGSIYSSPQFLHSRSTVNLQQQQPAVAALDNKQFPTPNFDINVNHNNEHQHQHQQTLKKQLTSPSFFTHSKPPIASPKPLNPSSLMDTSSSSPITTTTSSTSASGKNNNNGIANLLNSDDDDESPSVTSTKHFHSTPSPSITNTITNSAINTSTNNINKLLNHRLSIDSNSSAIITPCLSASTFGSPSQSTGRLASILCGEEEAHNMMTEREVPSLFSSSIGKLIIEKNLPPLSTVNKSAVQLPPRTQSPEQQPMQQQQQHSSPLQQTPQHSPQEAPQSMWPSKSTSSSSNTMMMEDDECGMDEEDDDSPKKRMRKTTRPDEKGLLEKYYQLHYGSNAKHCKEELNILSATLNWKINRIQRWLDNRRTKDKLRSLRATQERNFIFAGAGAHHQQPPQQQSIHHANDIMAPSISPTTIQFNARSHHYSHFSEAKNSGLVPTSSYSINSLLN
ncbi:hypothetical protein SAMD00019534_058130 [Acytostelium subglobosum LB1]|uniref:hypothetical protein n=1 Tax=Acytostelium subglobosum LB1 TaxID=1410327 RepID=UPI000645148E|nr:hypothetical protein SAMD00019534_058130 [Acytostelium subglobosum LB1]GAM22638.1 hypothetical protein SAMD00019534_058130 [Acytostelium subglobosum LB1]|eukprot:XP_012754758.1 hypothetical protein SAMD00019534_058130 [Acytostelium subglobosum LB1]